MSSQILLPLTSAQENLAHHIQRQGIFAYITCDISNVAAMHHLWGVWQGNQVSLHLKEICLVDQLKDKGKILHIFNHAEYTKHLLFIKWKNETYVTDSFLCGFDLANFWCVRGGMNLVLIFVVYLPIQPLHQRREYSMC